MEMLTKKQINKTKRKHIKLTNTEKCVWKYIKIFIQTWKFTNI